MTKENIKNVCLLFLDRLRDKVVGKTVNEEKRSGYSFPFKLSTLTGRFKKAGKEQLLTVNNEDKREHDEEFWREKILIVVRDRNTPLKGIKILEITSERICFGASGTHGTLSCSKEFLLNYQPKNAKDDND